MAMSAMASDIIIQGIFLSIMLFMFLWMLNIPQSLFTKFRYRQKPSYTAKRHFVLGAQLLSQSQSQSTNNRTKSIQLAKSAADHADQSIAINPTDAAAHILKALALDLQGFSTSALEALDVALSPLAAKSLSDGEKSDALFKRAQIKVKVSRGVDVDAAVVDLVEAVRLKPENAAALRLLGECYEKMGKKEEAFKVYTDLAKVEPKSNVRLGSDSI